MPSQLLEVSLALSEGSLQWHVLLLRANPLVVQCQPVTNRNQNYNIALESYEEKPVSSVP